MRAFKIFFLCRVSKKRKRNSVKGFLAEWKRFCYNEDRETNIIETVSCKRVALKRKWEMAVCNKMTENYWKNGNCRALSTRSVRKRFGKIIKKESNFVGNPKRKGAGSKEINRQKTSEKEEKGMDKEEVRRTILNGTLEVFNQKGLKFTMDDIAKELGISKKTIYKVFDDKEKMFLEMVDFLFDQIKVSEEEVMRDKTMTTLEKIRKILVVMPESYREIDLRKLYELKEKYPAIYHRVEERLETGWENTIALLEKGMKEGVIRKVPICIVKMMLEAALEQFFQRDILIANNLNYGEALDHVVDILVDGIATR